MKQGFRNIIVLFMAVLVLASTMSFTLDLHYCGDHLVDYSLLQANTCGMDSMIDIPSDKIDSCAPEVAQKSCCSDKQFKVEGQEDLKPSFADFHINEQVFIASLAYSYIYIFESVENDFVPFQTYRPPHLTRDVQLLHESFLI